METGGRRRTVTACRDTAGGQTLRPGVSWVWRTKGQLRVYDQYLTSDPSDPLHMGFPSHQDRAGREPRAAMRGNKGVVVAAADAPAAKSLEPAGYPQRQAAACIQTRADATCVVCVPPSLPQSSSANVGKAHTRPARSLSLPLHPPAAPGMGFESLRDGNVDALYGT